MLYIVKVTDCINWNELWDYPYSLCLDKLCSKLTQDSFPRFLSGFYLIRVLSRIFGLGGGGGGERSCDINRVGGSRDIHPKLEQAYNGKLELSVCPQKNLENTLSVMHYRL